MTKLYITVDDAQGATYSDGSFAVSTTRMLFENNEIYGYENLIRKFPSADHFRQFLTLIRSAPSGSDGRFSWRHE